MWTLCQDRYFPGERLRLGSFIKVCLGTRVQCHAPNLPLTHQKSSVFLSWLPYLIRRSLFQIADPTRLPISIIFLDALLSEHLPVPSIPLVFDSLGRGNRRIEGVHHLIMSCCPSTTRNWNRTLLWVFKSLPISFAEDFQPTSFLVKFQLRKRQFTQGSSWQILFTAIYYSQDSSTSLWGEFFITLLWL